MQKSLLISVDNVEKDGDSLEVRTIPKLSDKVLIRIGTSKILVTIDELQEALTLLQEFNEELEHKQDTETPALPDVLEFEQLSEEKN